jgi:translation initiation factor IF-3
MFTRDALNLARQQGLDLVEVAPNAVPPVCKIMDYGKFKYEQTKKERDSRKNRKVVVVKEVQFSPTTDEHDVETLTRRAKRFLDEGDKVKLTVKFKGRELAHQNIGRDLLERVRVLLGDNLIVEAPSKMEGKNMTMIVSQKPAKAPTAPRPPRAEGGQNGQDGAAPRPEGPRPQTPQAVEAPQPEAEPVRAGS